jgi:hypothetical protein
MSVRYYEPATPAYWDMKTLTGKWYWRGLHWLLKKLGAGYREHVPESVRVEERTINHADIQTVIRDSQRALSLLWDKKATTLLVGRDEMAKLMRDAYDEPIAFRAEIPLGNGNDFRYMGLRVVCVPWLEGWAVLPDLDKI